MGSNLQRGVGMPCRNRRAEGEAVFRGGISPLLQQMAHQGVAAAARGIHQQGATGGIGRGIRLGTDEVAGLRITGSGGQHGSTHAFFVASIGLSAVVQQQREIVIILADKKNKVAIMKAISEKCGSDSPAHGMVISLPVDDVAGIRM